jgi:hypothetical protein
VASYALALQWQLESCRYAMRLCPARMLYRERIAVTNLKDLLGRTLAEGWAAGRGDVESVREQARALGWRELPPRRGDDTLSVLTPVDNAAARPNSLSAQYGLGQQPLHTDGAHLLDPPDVLVLAASRPTITPTLLWRPATLNTSIKLPGEALRHGMFLVRNGRDSFYSPALADGRYRYDPGCMAPCDLRAREVSSYFERALPHAHRHDWSTTNEVLLIDNRRVLHARPAVPECDSGRELVRVAFQKEAAG